MLCYTTVTRPFGQFDVNFTFTVNLQCNENVKALGEFTRKSRTLGLREALVPRPRDGFSHISGSERKALLYEL